MRLSLSLCAIAAAVFAQGCEVAIEFRSRADGSSADVVSDVAAIEASADATVDADAAIDAAVIDDVVEEDAVEEDALEASTDVALACATDVECGAGQRCVAGVCAPRCVPGVEQCNGMDDDCDGAIDEDDPMLPVCAAGQVCRSGACVVSGGCAAGLTACGGSCVNLATDVRNCGACGSSCPAGLRCAAGACTP